MSGAKTEEPTTVRLQRAREEGDSGASLYASRAVAFVTAIALFPATLEALVGRFEVRLHEAFGQASARDVGADSALAGLSGVARDVAVLSAPVLAGVAIVVVVGSLVQGAGFVRSRRRVPSAGPFARLGEFSSRAQLFAIARALAGGAFVAWAVTGELHAHAGDLGRAAGRLAFVGPLAAAMVSSVAWKVALAGVALGTGDIIVARAAWRGRLRMSRDDVRRERKDAEGDPLTKQARERERGEAAAQGTLADMPLARIVVTERGTAACALRYEGGGRAPIVVITGAGRAADDIVRRARELGVAVAEEAVTARALMKLTAGEPIPEGLYEAVADLLSDLSV